MTRTQRIRIRFHSRRFSHVIKCTCVIYERSINEINLSERLLPPSTTTRLTSLCRTTVPVRYSWLALASTLNFLAGFCRLRILRRDSKVLNLDTNSHYMFELQDELLSCKTHTCTLQCERRQWGLLLISWPSSLFFALLWACELHWPPHELCKREGLCCSRLS